MGLASRVCKGRAGAGTDARRAALRCLLLGQPGAGRTLFARRFAAYLGKDGTALELIDAAGLPEVVHPDAAAREGAARALRALLEADVCLHVVDAAAVGGGAPVGAVDRALAAYARAFLPGRYALLAGKVDHPLGRAGMLKLQRELGPERVIPVSALTGTGFREVRAFLASITLS